jgi:hypothetical protein
VRGSASASNTVSFTPFQINFSPKLQIEVLQTLNTKVVKQLTLYKNDKGSWVVLSTGRGQIAGELGRKLSACEQ